MAKYGVNKVILIGNLGRDPEVKTFDNGGKVAQFPIATSESYRDREGNQQTRTEWHNIVFFNNNLIEKVIEPYVKKGNSVYVEGSIRSRQYQDQQGVTKYFTDIICRDINLLGGNRSETDPNAYQNYPEAQYQGGSQAPDSGSSQASASEPKETYTNPPANNDSSDPLQQDNSNDADDLPF